MRHYRLNNIKLPLEAAEEEVLPQVLRTIGAAAVQNFRIVKKSLDARRKDRLFWVYAAAFEYDGALPAGGDLAEVEPEEIFSNYVSFYDNTQHLLLPEKPEQKWSEIPDMLGENLGYLPAPD